ANLGDVESQLQLARFYYREKKYEDAFQWYLKAKDAGHPDGMNGVGLCYFKGLGIEQDKAKGEYYLRLGVDKGSTKAMCNLANFIDSPESGELYMKAAKLGDEHAQLKIGRHFMEPQLTSWKITNTRDTDEAFHWFMKSALQGNKIAQYEVGLFYEKGVAPCIRNTEKALKWFEKSSAQGLKVATFSIGRLYANGIDDQCPDFKSAFFYYKKAADAGLAEAQYRTGLTLFYGRCVSEDKYKAYEYLLKAAEQGYSDAQFYVALLLATGQGVEQNLQLAKEWLTAKSSYPSEMDDYEWKKYDLLDYLNKDASEISITECTPIDLAFAKIDSFGVLYSQDGRKLLRYASEDAYYSSYFGVLKQQTLIDYEVPEGVEIICDEAFQECEPLECIKLPNSVLHIGERAFLYCENLNSVILPSKITTLLAQTFYGCTSLREICLPASIETIEGDALVGVRGLTSNSKKFIVKDGCLVDVDNETLVYFIGYNTSYYKIPKDIRNIGDYAFRMSTLTGVYIPDTIEEIGEGAFENCLLLEKIEFCYHSLRPQLKNIGSGAFIHCESLQEIVLPEGLELIGTQAFSYCLNLKIVILPDTLVEIKPHAFEGTSLLSITLPVNLKNLGNNAFAGSKLIAINSESPLFLITMIRYILS
ncbi:MAG: leucine-rich repeat protein, partial [Muribaculaceae bacterium]|nr:leucine-rich repeat protein [Muribaculaceae bacterium]